MILKKIYYILSVFKIKFGAKIMEIMEWKGVVERADLQQNQITIDTC